MASALTYESTAKIWTNRTFLSTWAQLQIKVPSLKYRPGLHRRQQHYRNWRPSGTKRISPLAKRSNCAPWLSWYSCTPAKSKHWQRTCRIKLNKLHATEIRCFGKLLSISYKDHIFDINEEVRDRIRQAIMIVKVVSCIKISRACEHSLTRKIAGRRKKKTKNALG